ncbi:MAG: DUF4037 domain-containing protein [Thermomicrobiales bacterium]
MLFVSGHRLSRALYEDVVAPLMATSFPGLPFAAVLIGEGSDVLGYDTERSMDHDWGPRLNLLLREEDIESFKLLILSKLDDCLPPTILGLPTDLNGSSDLPGDPIMLHHNTGDGRTHGIRIDTPSRLLDNAFGIRSIEEFDLGHWLTTSPQTLLEWTSGPMFRDDVGDWTRIRRALTWYPGDVWRYQMAARWKRIAQQEAFVGRCGEVGDDLGSQLVAMNLIEDSIKLAFLQERTYAPYAKWLGTAFSHLDGANELGPWLDQIRFATSWNERENGLVNVMSTLGNRQNDLGVCDSVDVLIQPYFDRPFRVLFAERFTRALQDSILDQRIRALPPDLGGTDTFVDSADALLNSKLRTTLAAWFRRFLNLEITAP